MPTNMEVRVGYSRNTKIFPQKLSMITGPGDQHRDYKASDHVKERGFKRMNMDGEETHVTDSRPAEDVNG